jgi:two-component system sensor histidine kinase AlgZ
MVRKTGPVGQDLQEFFIPDLCAARPVLIMVLVAELMVLVFVLLGSDRPRFDPAQLGVVSLFVQWNVLLCAAVLCASRRAMARVRLQTGVLAAFVIILLVTLFSSLVARQLVPSDAGAELPAWWVWRNLIVALVIGGLVLRYFYLQRELQEREQAELTARLESLRARIRPHFLFNTMNSIASLIATRPLEAEQVVEDLSELFRASLSEDDSDGTVAEEVHRCELYLRIEQLRLGDRLRVNWQVQEEVRRQSMPALLLQPLVENAVYHGVAQIDGGGTIEISVRAVDGQLEVLVINPVPETPREDTGGHRIALNNIEQRLLGLYGESIRFDAGNRGGLFRVLFTYPLESMA